MNGNSRVRSARSDDPMKEDVLQVAISLVKSHGADLDPAEFVSGVALAFKALSSEGQPREASHEPNRPGVTTSQTPRLNQDVPSEPPRRWPKAS